MNRLPLCSLAIVLAMSLFLSQSPLAGMAAEPTVRVATFNASMYRSSEGELLEALRTGKERQIQRVAEIIQRVHPDILLINEFDFDPSGRASELFRRKYLEQSQFGQKPIRYDHSFASPVNTGIDSSFDLDQNGATGQAADAWGYGNYKGQYGLLILSKFPLDLPHVRTFQHFRWQDMPGALLPDNPATSAPGDYYSPEVLARFPLSSKTHADVPIMVGSKRLHFLVSHPTPPVFDGPEDRNGRRNHDEVRLWHDYITPGTDEYLYDDNDRKGHLARGTSFVIAGDLNSDPHDGDSTKNPVQLLLNNALVNNSAVPSSQGAVEAAERNPKANEHHHSKPQHDTGDFGRVGNMRLDYVLPSADLTIVASGVFWPAFGNHANRPEAVLARAASDHRMVWVDLRME